MLIMLALLFALAVGITILAIRQASKERKWFKALFKWAKDLFDLLYSIG